MSIRKLFPLAGFLLVLAVGCDQKADPTTANKKAVQDSFAAMDKQDYARCRELWPAVNPPQKPIKIVGSPDMDREELISFLQTYWKAFPDTNHTIQNLVAQGDLVVAWVTCEGTQLGDFEGLPASGKHIHYAGVHLVKFANGKIQEWWVMDDNLGMMQQLGMELSAPKAPDPNRKGK